MHADYMHASRTIFLPFMHAAEIRPGGVEMSVGGPPNKKEALGFPCNEPPPATQRNHPPTASAAEAFPSLYVIREVPVNCHFCDLLFTILLYRILEDCQHFF